MIAAHRRFVELAAASLDFELSRTEADQLSWHLRRCRVCTEEVRALRMDARTLAALPPRAMPSTGTGIVRPWSERGRNRPSLIRVLVLAATLALLAAALVTVGSEVARRMQFVVAPDASPSAPLPSREPPSSRPSPLALQVELLDAGGLGVVRSLAATADRIVSVGGPDCTADSEGTVRCWAVVWTSEDGSVWTQVDASDALEIGDTTAPGGLADGIEDVAAGPSGFLAVGHSVDRTCTDSLCPPVASVWTSTDGIEWTVNPGVLGEGAQPHAVTAFRTGWIVVGESYLPTGPRAAVWRSDDGATWTAADDGPMFDIGGYLDTGEVLLAGGIADVAARGGQLVAGGRRCDSFGGACEVAIWTSSDARAWSIESSATGFGALRTVAAGAEGFVVLGSLCSDSDCPRGGERAGGFRSGDGATWEEVDLDVQVQNQGVAAVAAPSAFAAVIATESSSHVTLYASADGRTWAAVPETVEIEGALLIRDVATTVLPNGTTIIIGTAETDQPEATTFVLRIPGSP